MKTNYNPFKLKYWGNFDLLWGRKICRFGDVEAVIEAAVVGVREGDDDVAFLLLQKQVFEIWIYEKKIIGFYATLLRKILVHTLWKGKKG